VLGLTCWHGPVEIADLGGGLTNTNFKVTAADGRAYAVRVGDDMPLQHILRFNEQAASHAAARAGLSPPVVHHEAGVLVLDFIHGRTLTPEDVRRDDILGQILALIKRCHREMPLHMRGAALAFWPFQSMRDYLWTLSETPNRHQPRLAHYGRAVAELEEAVGPIRLVYGHNDLLAANLIDDGRRLWLIDWDYGGYGSPLFDLANLATNNGLDAAQEAWLLDAYFEGAVDAPTRRAFTAMKAASLLRESMWSMVAEIQSRVDFDYAAYTDDYLDRFEAAWAAWAAWTRSP
jgi:thiamine kinase-like enzyme